MIKDFETYIREGRMGRLIQANDNIVRKEDELHKEEVMSYIDEGCRQYCKKVIIRYEGNKPIVDIEGDFYMRRDITKIPFQFGKVTGYFSCHDCKNLTSLEGCPKEVGNGFSCQWCQNLTSLEGCPQKVGGKFDCSFCKKLTSLAGCPEKVGKYFNCVCCTNLTSLEGCPKKVEGSLQLEGDFYCHSCGKQFTEEEVHSLCDVKGNIEV